MRETEKEVIGLGARWRGRRNLFPQSFIIKTYSLSKYHLGSTIVIIQHIGFISLDR
jgi:hypothetical protein